jgi:hypothetical protein
MEPDLVLLDPQYASGSLKKLNDCCFMVCMQSGLTRPSSLITAIFPDSVLAYNACRSSCPAKSWNQADDRARLV